jgi:hypothetical protein
MANLYTKQTDGKRTFTGVVNPMNQDNKISIFDDYNVNEITQPTKPKGINNYLFEIMKTATSEESTIFKNL